MADVRISTLLLLFVTCFALISGTCNRNDGPSGEYECVALSKYNNISQWATCLTDTYIQAKAQSRGKHHYCDDRNATYCYYQCMCETHNECEGPDVYGDCACDPNHPQTQIGTTAESPRPTLPPWCFSPDGKTCSWYRECLEERYPCEGTGATYAITYAEKFCDLYSDHYMSFSINGQHWIDAVRKCLQVELVPVLRPWVSATCLDIKNMTFASHSRCYKGPSSGVSFCSLSLVDRWQLFWTIKGAFSDSFVETMKGVWDAMYKCLKHSTDPVSFEQNHVAVTHIFVKKQELMARDPDVFAGKTIDLIAVMEKWAEKGLSWFGYSGLPNMDTDHMRNNSNETSPMSTTEQEFRINIILASKRVFDLNAPKAIEVNIKEAVMSFASQVQSALIQVTVDGARVDVLSMAGCGDIECNSTFVEVVAPVNIGTVTPPNTGTTPSMSGSLALIVGILSLVYKKF